MKQSTQQPKSTSNKCLTGANKQESEQQKQSKSKATKTASSDGQACAFIENTPFFVGKLKNELWAIGCGNHRSNIVFKTQTEAEEYVKAQKIDWELLGMFITEMVKHIEK